MSAILNGVICVKSGNQNIPGLEEVWDGGKI